MRRVRGSAAAATAAVAAVALLAGCGAVTARQASAGGSGTPARQPATASAAKTCEVPASLAAPASGQQLTGPAVTALAGGAASRGFSLDGSQFSVGSPPPVTLSAAYQGWTVHIIVLAPR